MRFMSVASGSSGNCIFVGSDNTQILVDVGITKKRINEGLKKADTDLQEIDAILITHEHIDHTKALGVISRSYNIPIYATKDTCDEISIMSSLGEFDLSLLKPIETDKKFNVGDIEVLPHNIWHDAVDPCCYSLYNNGKKISIATDMGDFDDYIIDKLSDSDAMLIESNHDVRMLEAGPYPYQLKQRILGKRGHLSNVSSGKLIKNLLNDHIKAIFLGHLSKENNYPDLAYETVKVELMENDFSNDVRDFNLQVALRDTTSDLIIV